MSYKNNHDRYKTVRDIFANNPTRELEVLVECNQRLIKERSEAIAAMAASGWRISYTQVEELAELVANTAAWQDILHARRAQAKTAAGVMGLGACA